MTPDVNVLVAASRSDHPHHGIATSWLTDALRAAADGVDLLVFPMVLASFLRLVMHPKVFVVPTGAADAIAFADALLQAPGVQLSPLGEEWPMLRAACLDKKLKANDVPDAWLASAVQTCGDHLVTFDKGFRRLLKKSELTVLS